ncbi:MAG TPA: PHB depolymerase family esterase, partial [Polyangiaceae bacterium]|nr:PHB depolymerase family esterase [Polyangiaceae bacterium]
MSANWSGGVEPRISCASTRLHWLWCAVVLALGAACGSSSSSGSGQGTGGTSTGAGGTSGAPSVAAGTGGSNGPVAGSRGTGAVGAGMGGSTVVAGGGSGNSVVGSGAVGGGTGSPGAGAPAGGSSAGGSSAGGAAGKSGGSAGSQGGAGGATCTKQATPSMDCSAPLAPGDQKQCMVGTRSYYIYVPKNFDLCTPAALVIDAHGATQTAESQLLGMPAFCTGSTCWKGPGSGWRLEAEAPGGGFILVTPSSATSGNTWDATTDPPVMLQIIDAVKKVANVDPRKIYFTGISNGAALSYWTACENPGVFAGISPNSGGVLGGAQCNGLSKPMSDIQFDDEPDFA